MKVLAINTATRILSVAIVEGEKTLYLYETAETRDQGNALMQHIEEGLRQNSLSYADIGLLAAVTGPGSFTGIRIGLAAARGIAMAAGIPLTGITSFELFSKEKAGYENIVAVESWRDELYFLHARKMTNQTPLSFIEKINRGEKFFITGDARVRLAEVLPGAAVDGHEPNAVDVARLACEKGDVQGEKPVPFYLREADISRPKEK